MKLGIIGVEVGQSWTMVARGSIFVPNNNYLLFVPFYLYSDVSTNNSFSKSTFTNSIIAFWSLHFNSKYTLLPFYPLMT